ncbi:MAG: lipoyl protein ligase domain-containing protein, partial [Desulfobacteraceae bacterium]
MIYINDLYFMDYEEALGLQHSLVVARASREVEEDLLLLLEHPEVFTLGRRGGREFLRVEDSWLSSSGMSLIQTERGGYITYHGPGQLVGYPIVDLWARGWAVPSFVEMLEGAMIMVSDEFGVKAERSSKNRGVWVGGAKLG